MLGMLALPALARADDKSDKAAAEKAARARSDDRLDALEMKLQALLKEIQALRSESKTEVAPRAERKELTGRLIEQKRAAEKAAAAGEKRAKVVRIGDDGKPIEIELKIDDLKDLEKLKKLGMEQLEKLKELDHLKKLGAEQLDKMGRLKLEAAELEKLKGLKLDEKDLAKLKEAQLKLAEKAKDLAGIQLRLSDGKDGKPLVIEGSGNKGARVELVPGTAEPQRHTIVQSVSDPNSISLTRVTYTLTGEQARALDEFLKAFAKARVLETKIDGDKLVVTTTPDVQSTIGQVVALMSGKPAGGVHRYSLNVTPAYQAPVRPAATATQKESKPAKPKEKDKKEKKDKDDDE
jgi:hypothetical protein